VARVIIDGMNVIGSRPTGWWRDRDAAVRTFVEDLVRLAAHDGGDICVVFDGLLPAGLAEGPYGGVEVVASGRRGRNAADDRVVEMVEADPDPGSVAVVTSDRALRDRVRRLGASVGGPMDLLRRIEVCGDPSAS